MTNEISVYVNDKYYGKPTTFLYSIALVIMKPSWSVRTMEVGKEVRTSLAPSIFVSTKDHECICVDWGTSLELLE